LRPKVLITRWLALEAACACKPIRFYRCQYVLFEPGLVCSMIADVSGDLGCHASLALKSSKVVQVK